jgi:hypothetical protein
LEIAIFPGRTLHISLFKPATIFGADSFRYEFADQAGSDALRVPGPSAMLSGRRAGGPFAGQSRTPKHHRSLSSRICATGVFKAGSISLRAASNTP